MTHLLVRPLALAAVLLISSASSFAALSPACQSKHDAVAAKIAAAKETGNTEQQSSLQKALGSIDAQCTDAKLTAMHDKAVTKQEATLKKAQDDLAKAQTGGNASKIKKQQGKVDAAQAKLDKLKAMDPLK
jgi:uncharacterized lipoprotein NlpE involved in copper resistance